MQLNPANTFLLEAEELLSEIEEAALALDAGEPGPELINRLFRGFHTIKGSGAMCGFQQVAAFTHHVETLLDEVRKGTVPVTPRLTELVLSSRDEIRNLLAAEQRGETAQRAFTGELITMLQALCPMRAEAPKPQPASAAAGEPKAKPHGASRTWQIEFHPSVDLLSCGGNPLLLWRDLARLGECRVAAHTDAVPALEELDPGSLHLWWSVTLCTEADYDTIRDSFIFVEDGANLEIAAVAEDAPTVTTAPSLPVPAREAAAPDSQSTVVRQALSKESTVRVPSARLDRLVGLVGELVVTHSRLERAASQVDLAELAAPVEEIERLVAELRDDVLSIRMMPIGSIFCRFRRLVHDLSAELGKQIDLITEGAETELDKSILDQLGEPLVHLLRNSIDHGIEGPAQRVAAGKSARGVIRLTAEHTGSDVVVSVEDDGRGLDRAAILAKAVERQLVSPEQSLTDKEILNLILLPGFSTASQVTNISGRGVGMDVVKRQIDALRGSVSIASDAGQGTAIRLRLPLTLAIIEGLLVESGGEQFILPMTSVAENVELERWQRTRNNGRTAIAVRGELVPYIDLREAFGLGGEPPAIEMVVIVHHEEQRVGLVVDRVLGTHQTVLQSLGKYLQKVQVVSGTTVMGDGSVALVLDIRAVVRHAEQRASAIRERQATE